jgi:hypothetical protein
MTKELEEIYEFVLPEMAAHGIPDTPALRSTFLQGMVDAWEEDVSDDHPKKAGYVKAAHDEITRLNSLVLTQ